MLLIQIGDVERGYQFGDLSLQLAENLQSKRALARTAFIVFTFLSWIRKPLTDGIEPMLNAHRMGLQVGDLEYSSMCLCTYSNLYFAVGLPLGPFVDDMKQFIEQLELYHQNQPIALMVCFYQLALNLTGKSNSFLSGFRYDDDGEAMQIENFYLRFMVVDEVEGTGQGVTFGNLKFVTLVLAYISQDVDELDGWFEVEQLMRRVHQNTHFINLYMILFSGLAAFTLYRAKRKRKYYRKAMSSISLMKKISKKGGINTIPLLHLLLAEKGSFGKNVESIKKTYDSAITTFARFGLIHLEAIACERAGDVMATNNQKFWSVDYYERSIQRYTEWGAIAKAEIMRGKHANDSYSQFSERKHTESVLVSVRGKRRYDPSMWDSIEKADIVNHHGRRKSTNIVTASSTLPSAANT